jgi:hypothetical protein
MVKKGTSINENQGVYPGFAIIFGTENTSRIRYIPFYSKKGDKKNPKKAQKSS